jgi:hypothetical protein
VGSLIGGFGVENFSHGLGFGHGLIGSDGLHALSRRFCQNGRVFLGDEEERRRGNAVRLYQWEIDTPRCGLNECLGLSIVTVNWHLLGLFTLRPVQLLWDSNAILQTRFLPARRRGSRTLCGTRRGR